MTEQARTPEMLVALYASLADAEAVLDELESIGIPYPTIHLCPCPSDIENTSLAEQADLPPSCWLVSVALQGGRDERIVEVLRGHRPLRFEEGHEEMRSDTERGAIAWRHYVFETPAATGEVTDAAGTCGTTGVISSGVFATGARAENLPVVDNPAQMGEERSDGEGGPCTSGDDQGLEQYGAMLW